MADRKRERDESALDAALQSLEASVSKEVADKTKALKDLRELIDEDDESYETQKQAAAGGVLNTLMQLLEDDSEAVAAEAALALTALCANSKAAQTRLDLTKTTATATVDKVPLNPVQELIPEQDGLVSVLVNLRFNDNSALSEAAQAAITAILAFNRENQVSYLREVVHRLVQGETRALEALEAALPGTETRDDVAVLLDQTLQPVLGTLRKPRSDEERLDALTLLGSVVEQRKGAAAFLVMEGALPHVTQALVSGDTPTQDAATHLLWLLVKDNRKMLNPAKDALGVTGTQLLGPLLKLIEAGAQQRDKEDAEMGAADDESSSEEEEEEEKEEEEGELQVDNSDDALLLLRALAAQDGEVAEKLKGEQDILGSSCNIM